MVRGVRGAVTVEQNSKSEIVEATKEVIGEMIERNNIKPEDVAQVIITTTEDLTAVFPAQALRLFQGWSYVPVMCAQEISVSGSMRRCIRIMMTINTDKTQKEIHHVYLGEAKKLRPDIQD
ncbi:chorismate mutase [Bacillus taeanensis]|uniref:chorismate mutase n=1 Tax=Bacillus taeanensis TaxID=273032 RepID=A0A366XV68_9BACI|nr:chorismate mutase [Bacillus taeanensis]RBW70280.1 chorismate mutase [Bacillus taeanensis]